MLPGSPIEEHAKRRWLEARGKEYEGSSLPEAPDPEAQKPSTSRGAAVTRQSRHDRPRPGIGSGQIWEPRR